jgi:hypothetical protein
MPRIFDFKDSFVNELDLFDRTVTLRVYVRMVRF